MTAGAVLGFFALIVIIFLIFNWNTLKARGQRRFSERGQIFTPRSNERLWKKPSLMARKIRSSGISSPAPVIPAKKVSAPAFRFENTHCESCNAGPQVRFRNATSGTLLEFCGHHANQHQVKLLEQGFIITADLRKN